MEEYSDAQIKDIYGMILECVDLTNEAWNLGQLTDRISIKRSAERILKRIGGLPEKIPKNLLETISTYRLFGTLEEDCRFYLSERF